MPFSQKKMEVVKEGSGTWKLIKYTQTDFSEVQKVYSDSGPWASEG